MPRQEKLLTVVQVAEQLGVHHNTVRNWADRGLINTIRLPSGYRRFTQQEVDRVRAEMGLDEMGKAAA